MNVWTRLYIFSPLRKREVCGTIYTDVENLCGNKMADDTKKGMKSEVLSMRMDPRTRFIVEFIARVRGQSITTVVDRAIQEAANNLRLSDGRNETWEDFWHVSEGIRSLKVMSEKRTFPNYEEEFKVSFTRSHWPFFYITNKFDEYKEWSVGVIWPRFDEFVEIWRNTKATNYWAATKAMQKAISDAGLIAPEWPIAKPPAKPISPNPPKQEALGGGDIDDDIPF
jgi:hypothetical protein